MTVDTGWKTVLKFQLFLTYVRTGKPMALCSILCTTMIACIIAINKHQVAEAFILVQPQLVGGDDLVLFVFEADRVWWKHWRRTSVEPVKLLLDGESFVAVFETEVVQHLTKKKYST